MPSFIGSLAKVSLLIVSALGLAACGATVQAGQRGLTYRALREPALDQQSRPEGFYWLWPWNNIITYDVTWQSRTEDLEVLTSDDLHVATKVTVTFRPHSADHLS